MSSNNNLKKIRSEYMKKFRDPKWETFSKSYEDSVKYRLTRRVMEQTHRPLFWDGWDSGTESSGRSSPKNRENGESFSDPPQSSSEANNGTADVEKSGVPLENGDLHIDTAAVEQTLPIENGGPHVTENGPSEPVLRRRQRHRATRSEPVYPDCEPDSDGTGPSLPRKPSRAKSQPPGTAKERASNRENRRSFIRYDWSQRQAETTGRRTPSMRMSVSAGEIHRADAAVQTHRESDKRGKALDRRRARSADLEKSRKSSELTVAEDRWMTEYMRCFSARLR